MNTEQKLQLLIQAATCMVNSVDHDQAIKTAAGDLAVALAAVMTAEQYAAWKATQQ